MSGALLVIAIAVAILAVVQVGMLLALLIALGRMAATLRELRTVERSFAAAADEIGRAAHQVGDLAGTTRNAAESLLGVFAFGRLFPKAGNGLGALRSGLDLALTLVRTLRGRGGRDEGARPAS